jgi:hypothetical protein
MASAATDVFHKEDIQVLAQAVDQHDHTAGKGKSVAPVAGSITNAMLGSDVARANLLTNGGFEIWQRGNGPFTGTGAYSADRWTSTLAGTDTLSVSRSASIPAGTGSTWCAACTFVLGSGAGATALTQTLKQADGNQIQGRTFTFSIAVYATVAGAVRALASADGTGAPLVTSAFHPGDSTYHTLTVTITVPQNATGLNVGCYFAASTGANCFLDNANLVVGSQPADYVPMHPADDLARCQRYYEVLGGVGTQFLGVGQVYGTTTAYQLWSFKSAKAATPTVTTSAAANFGLLNSGGGFVATTSIGATSQTTQNTGLSPVVASGLVAGNATMLQAANANALLFAESNP